MAPGSENRVKPGAEMNRSGADMIAGRANYPATDAIAALGDAKSVGGKEMNTASRANYLANKENYSGPRATNPRLEEMNSGRR